MSIAAAPLWATCCLASVTKELPGPNSLSLAGTLSVP